MKPKRFKEAIYRQLARIGSAVASPRRLELLDLLAQGPQTVDRLASKAGQSVANTSQHLQRLRAARLVEAEKRGLYVTYRLADLPQDREIVAYCRGPYCVLAVEAVARLRTRNFSARRLEDGLPDWRARGLPVAVGPGPGGPTA